MLRPITYDYLISKNEIGLTKSIEDITNGLPKFVYTQLTQQISKENATIIMNYVKCQKTEINLCDTYRTVVIITLTTLAKYFKNKNFKQLTKSDIINYLDSLRKSEEADPSHKWIGTYNFKRTVFLKFFKWLYYPTEVSKKRPIPNVMRDVPALRRKELSIYKPDDLWTQDNDRLFFKYCPDKRIQCYHAISRDASTRPDEILKLRVKDITFKLAGNKTYAEISVNGKTGSRVIPLFNSIPYIRDWIKNHPQPGNSNALLIPSMNSSTIGRKLNSMALNRIYHKYRKKIFPSLLTDENVPLEDKTKIRELLKKPWNPYIRRHTGLTEKSKMKQLNEHQLRQHAGWSPRSQMHLKYIHYFGNESSDSLLEAYGLVIREQKQSKILLYKQCTHCNEPNRPDSRFCIKCNMILTYDAYNETIEKEKQRELEVQNLRKDMSSMREQMNEIMVMVQRNPRLAYIKPEILVNKSSD